MDNGLNEALALYRASVRSAPSLMMEGLPVDSNRGVTSRGNTPHEKFASPETRAKVLEARLQEIEAFAQSRKIPTSNVYAAAESAMRTGKIPDLGQFGMAGDDAVATKQFLISNVLNVHGLEWTDYKGDPVLEAGESEGMRKGTQAHTGEWGRSAGGRPGSGRINVKQMKVAKTKRRRAGREAAEAGMREYEAGQETQDDVQFDPGRFMAEAFSARRQRSKQRRQAQAQGDVPRRGHGQKVDEPDVYKAVTRRDPRDVIDQGEITRSVERAEGGRESRYGTPLPPKHLKRVSLDRKTRGTSSEYRDVVSKPAKKLRQARQQSSVDVDPARYMDEEGGPYRTGGAPTRAPLSPARQNPGAGASINPGQYMKRDLLPKDVMNKLKQQVGEKIYGMPREELFRLARARGLLGTEESIEESLAEQTAEQALKARRAAQRHAQATAQNPRSTSKEKQVSRAVAQGQTDLAKGAAREGRRWQGQQALASTLAGASQGSGRLRPQQQVDVDRAERQGGWQGQLASQQARAKQTATALGMGRKSRGPQRYMRQESGPSADLLEEVDTLLNEHDYKAAAKKHGGSFKGYVQGNVGAYEFPSSEAAQKFANQFAAKTTATPKVQGSKVFIDEPTMGEAVRVSGAAPGGNADGISPQPGPTKAPWEEDEYEKARRKQEDGARSEIEKILGIQEGDPRNETWPKMGAEMARLMGVQESVEKKNARLMVESMVERKKLLQEYHDGPPRICSPLEAMQAIQYWIYDAIEVGRFSRSGPPKPEEILKDSKKFGWERAAVQRELNHMMQVGLVKKSEGGLVCENVNLLAPNLMEAVLTEMRAYPVRALPGGSYGKLGILQCIQEWVYRQVQRGRWHRDKDGPVKQEDIVKMASESGFDAGKVRQVISHLMETGLVKKSEGGGLVCESEGASNLTEGAFQDVVEADRRLQRRRGMSQEEVEAEEKALRERSETDKILGIMPGDPRAEAWPKVSDEVRRLMNLEDCGVFRSRRTPRVEEPSDLPLDEATVAGGMGGFIGAGLGGSLNARSIARPSYDDSYELPEDPEERMAAIKKMLSKHGLRQEGRAPENAQTDLNKKWDVHDDAAAKAAENEERFEKKNKTEIGGTESETWDEKKRAREKGMKEGVKEGVESPTFRTEVYDTHPSRWMKQR